jgi:hypothetical protein
LETGQHSINIVVLARKFFIDLVSWGIAKNLFVRIIDTIAVRVVQTINQIMLLTQFGDKEAYNMHDTVIHTFDPQGIGIGLDFYFILDKEQMVATFSTQVT